MKQPLAAVSLLILLSAAPGMSAADAPVSFGSAMRWYEKAAEDGSVKAQYLLGRMYETGEGRDRDPVAAAQWYRRAALQGYAAAQFRLGVMFSEGRGVARDASQAAAWYGKAAAQGHAAARFNLAFLHDLGIGVPRDRGRAEVLYRAAAEAGMAAARFNLGLLLADSPETERDRQIEAWIWLKRAADAGVSTAESALLAQTARLSPAEREKAAELIAGGRKVP